MATELDSTEQKLVDDLKAKLAARKVRILDMFRSWDADGDGQVSVKEFQKAVKRLNLGFQEDVVEALFKDMDTDGSGQLDLDELNHMLSGATARRVSFERLKESKAKQAKFAKLHAQSIEAAAKNARGKAIGEEALKGDLLAKLAARRARIVDVISSWDTDHSGGVSLEEFVNAIKKLKLSFSDDVVEALFRALDRDDSGEVDILELDKELKAARPRRDTAMRLKLSKAQHEARAVPSFKVGFASCLYKKSFNSGIRGAFGSTAKRDKYTSWIAARTGSGATPVQVGPGRYPQFEG